MLTPSPFLGWVQSPGALSLNDSTQYSRLEAYVKDLIRTFAKDTRILGWDLWNEPDNTNGGKFEEPSNKVALVNNLLPQVFAWARSQNPDQPLTSGLWKGGYYSLRDFDTTEQLQMDNSDIITFHR